MVVPQPSLLAADVQAYTPVGGPLPVPFSCRTDDSKVFIMHTVVSLVLVQGTSIYLYIVRRHKQHILTTVLGTRIL